MLFSHSSPSSMGARELAVLAKSKLKNQSPDKQRFKKRPTLKLGISNIRTMTTGINTDIDYVSNARKNATINNILLRFKVDIATLQKSLCWSRLL